MNSTTISFDNLDEEQNMTYNSISLQTFMTVNLIYISGFTIYKYYKNWSNQRQCNKLEMTNQELLNKITELENKNTKLTDAYIDFNSDKLYIRYFASEYRL